MQEIVDFIRQRGGQCGIIYARLRKTIDSLTNSLRDADIETSSFHAGLSNEARQRAQAEWMDESISVICATIAFGMVRMFMEDALFLRLLW
jgi:superfamily II DNA helicase RecQ